MKKLTQLLLLSIFIFFQLTAESIDLLKHREKIYSQSGEEGILKKIFSLIPSSTKFFVDFGASNGFKWSNTAYFREKEGWTGLSMDMKYENLDLNLHREMITKENINDLFRKYNVPNEFDLLSIDIDGNDFYVWMALKDYTPKVVCIEFNPNFPPPADKIVIYNPNSIFDGSRYHGASMVALNNLGVYKGYTFVCASGVNMFFIRNDLIQEFKLHFKNMGNPEKLFILSRIPYHASDKFNRPWTNSLEIIYQNNE